jgi:hypothetical protein
MEYSPKPLPPILVYADARIRETCREGCVKTMSHSLSTINNGPFMRNRFMIAVLSCVLAVGCAQLDIKEPVAKFQAATATATTTIGSYYQELNTYERNLYLLDRLVDPSKEVFLKEGGKDTPLLGKPFSQDAIDARLALFKRIADYAANLAELAGNDAPVRFQTNISALGTSLQQIRTDFTTLTQAGGVQSDAQAKDYIGPISQLIEFFSEDELSSPSSHKVAI